MIEIIQLVATWIGYIVLTSFGLLALASAWCKYRFQPTVDPEVKEMAKELDPNNPAVQAGGEVLMQNILDEVRELGRNETIRAEPKPLTHFDWSVDGARQEDIEHILHVLQKEGYYTHPLPDVENYKDEASWSRERAAVWRSEPDWHIVRFEEETGKKQVKEEIELPLPKEWEPAE